MGNANDTEQKYELDSDEEFDNQEVIVNSTDLRVKVTASSDKRENIMKCIGYLLADFIYDTHQYRRSCAGTGTVFHVSADGDTFILSCAHNIRTLVWHCTNCDIYINDKEQHNACNIDDCHRILINANRIRFIEKSIYERYEKVMDDDEKKKEIVEFGDPENTYPCDTNNVFIDEQNYEVYPTGSSGYDLCIIRFQQKTKHYQTVVENICLKNGKQMIEKEGYFNIWGFPDDKKNAKQIVGLFGMRSHNHGQYWFPIHKKTKRIYFKQNTVDTSAGQSGSSIWVKTTEEKVDIIAICGVHTGGNERNQNNKYNVGVLFDDHILEQINDFINNKPVYFALNFDKFDRNNIGKCHKLKGNHIIHNGDTYKYSSSFFMNIVSNGYHHWKFKIKSKPINLILGIWKTKNVNPPKDGCFTEDKNGYGYNVGTGFDVDGNKYGKLCTTDNILDMYLDFTSLTLKYSVNDEECGVLTQVENTAYKAAVYTFWNGESVEFISYSKS
eukprot:494640_1